MTWKVLLIDERHACLIVVYVILAWHLLLGMKLKVQVIFRELEAVKRKSGRENNEREREVKENRRRQKNSSELIRLTSGMFLIWIRNITF